MTNSPFDDPELRDAMRQAGIVHRPGLAAGMMKEIAPLLAAEGIDLESFNGSISDLNEALGKASERYNLALFSPVGVHLAGAVSVLRMFAQARAEGDIERAEHILRSIDPEPTETRPAVSHVIGVGVGRLDEWGRQPEVRRIVAAAKPQPWNAAAGKAARRILELAGRGRAFDGLDELHGRFGGLAVLEGTAIAVAAIVRAYAARKEVGVVEACDALLPGGDHEELLDPFTVEDYRVLEAFEAWLEDEGTFDDDEDEYADEVVDSLGSVFAIARANGIDPHDPETVGELLEALATAVKEAVGEDDADHALPVFVEAVDEYVHFQMDAGDPHADWEGAHALVEDALAVANPLVDLLDKLTAGEAGDVDARRAALNETPVVSAVPGLLAWIGKGRPASPSGTARRADIQAVATLLGIDAVGVSSKSAVPFDGGQPILDLGDVSAPPERLAVMAMNEIPELAAWWYALSGAGVIETAPSRLRPGPQASAWASAEEAPLESVEMVVGIFLAVFITSGGSAGRSEFLAPWDAQAIAMLVERLIRATAGEDLPVVASGTDASQLFTHRTNRQLAQLDRLGIVRITPDGEVDVPVGLRLAVLRGVLTADALLDGGQQSDPDPLR